jgi:hypothetical protein
MRPYTIVYSDKTFSLSFSEDSYSVTLSLTDQSKDFGSVRVTFPAIDPSDHQLLRNALRNGVNAFNSAFQSVITPMTKEEEELALDEIDF